jgi:hypothetical protein
MQITTIGLDIAKNVFQVHGIDATAPFDALPPGEVIERAVFSCSVEHPRRD